MVKPDLKAAAERLRERVNPSGAKYVMVRDERRAVEMLVEAQDNLLAAQALEALAWQQERGVSVEECSGKLDLPYGKYRVMGCDSAGHLKRYYADTPLGAVLAAIEGERDA